MIKKYKTDRWSMEIKVVEFERETTSMLIKENGSRIAKTSDWEQYHDTPELAQKALIVREQIKLDHARDQVKKHERNLELAKSIDLKQFEEENADSK